MTTNPDTLKLLADTFLALSNDSAAEANRLLTELNYATEASAKIEVAKAYKNAWEIVLAHSPAPVNEHGWGFPANAKKAHYFHNGRSLCGKWMFFGNPNPDQAPSPDDCVACTGKLRGWA